MSHDMEDMLRRAANEYPLKKPADRWDDVAAKMNMPAATTASPKSSGKFRVLIIFFILAALITGGLLISDRFYSINQNQPGQTATTGNYEEPQKNNFNADEKKTQQLSTSLATLPAAAQTENAILKPASPSIEYFNKTTSASGVDNSFRIWENNLDKNKQPVTTGFDPIPSFNLNNTHRVNKIKTPEPDHFPNIQDPVFRMPGEPINNRTNTLENRQNRHKYFYVGATGGLQFNAIKDQSFRRAGFQAGILAGYQLNKIVAIETGIIFSEKYYYSPARYFDMEEMKPTMPSGMEMIELNGSSKIIEIPVHVQFKKALGNTDHIVASTGISSYIMAEENNQYHIRMNGADSKMNGVYKKDRKYVAATIDFGLGYEKRINQHNYIRLQPQLQLPLQGIGLGDLPVKSLGARLTYIHNLR